MKEYLLGLLASIKDIEIKRFLSEFFIGILGIISVLLVIILVGDTISFLVTSTISFLLWFCCNMYRKVSSISATRAERSMGIINSLYPRNAIIVDLINSRLLSDNYDKDEIILLYKCIDDEELLKIMGVLLGSKGIIEDVNRKPKNKNEDDSVEV